MWPIFSCNIENFLLCFSSEKSDMINQKMPIYGGNPKIRLFWNIAHINLQNGLKNLYQIHYEQYTFVDGGD